MNLINSNTLYVVRRDDGYLVSEQYDPDLGMLTSSMAMSHFHHSLNSAAEIASIYNQAFTDRHFSVICIGLIELDSL